MKFQKKRHKSQQPSITFQPNYPVNNSNSQHSAKQLMNLKLAENRFSDNYSLYTRMREQKKK